MSMERTINDTSSGRLNDLYWRSSRTIDEIVDELAVGRSTLYAAIQPLSTGADCPTCGNSVVFTNRTNRAASLGTCEGCGMDVPLSEEEPVRPRRSSARAGTGAPGRNGTGDDRYDELRRWDRWRDELGSVAPERAALIGSAAAIGVVLGAAAVRALRH